MAVGFRRIAGCARSCLRAAGDVEHRSLLGPGCPSLRLGDHGDRQSEPGRRVPSGLRSRDQGGDRLRRQVHLTAQNNLYTYNSFPSQTLLGPEPDLSGAWSSSGCNEFTLTVDESSDTLYVSEWGRMVYSLNKAGIAQPNWDTSHETAAAGQFIAFDNSPTDSRGRLYLSLRSPENARSRPLKRTGDRSTFPATAPISPTTASPGRRKARSGKSATSRSTTKVTSSSWIRGKAVVDGFDSSGTFIRVRR